MAGELDKSWQDWVDLNVQRGCNAEEMLGILLGHKFSLEAIRRAMGSYFPLPSREDMGPRGQLAGVDYKALSEIKITRTKGAARVDTPKLQLYTMKHFMSDEECDKLNKIIETSLRPSTITTDDPDKYYRTSSTSDLSLIKNPFIRTIDKKIATTLGIRIEYSEGIQAQKYEVGQEFKQHTDFFEPHTEEYTKFASPMGNRTWTFMVYLNHTKKGGGTRFVNIGKTFTPEKGMAVIWNNLYPDGSPNPDTLHWGMKVEEGEKIIITKWFREKASIPMCY